MKLQELMHQADDAGLVDQMARQLGIEPGQARQGMARLAPAVARGIQRNAATTHGDGLEALFQVLGGAGGARPGTLEGVDGNAILSQIFGGKDVSRNVAGHAAQESGLDSSVLRKLLPLVASAAMMILSRQNQAAAGTRGAPAERSQSALGTLSDFFDADGDGSAVDDLLTMARRFF